MGVGVIAVLLVGNLRGIRQAGTLFAAPTYLFIFAVFALVAVGLFQAAGCGFHPTPTPPLTALEGVSVLLLLRAFASGATAMTGIEAISNAVPVFQPVEWRNARTALTWMVGLLIALFAGTIALIHFDGVVPVPSETVLSQLAHRSFGSGFLYALTQAATAAILLLAANTAYNDFGKALTLQAGAMEVPPHPHAPSRGSGSARVATRAQGHETENGAEETPEEVRHLLLVPVAELNLASMRALAYAASLQQPVLALHLSPTEEEAERFGDYWRLWGDHLPLEIVVSPYRAIVAPMINYLEVLHLQCPDLTLTVILPEIVVRYWWHRILHNATARRLRRALRPLPKMVVTTVPFHLPN